MPEFGDIMTLFGLGLIIGGVIVFIAALVLANRERRRRVAFDAARARTARISRSALLAETALLGQVPSQRRASRPEGRTRRLH